MELRFVPIGESEVETAALAELLSSDEWPFHAKIRRIEPHSTGQPRYAARVGALRLCSRSPLPAPGFDGSMHDSFGYDILRQDWCRALSRPSNSDRPNSIGSRLLLGISGCLAQAHPGLFLSMLNEPERGQARPGSGQVGRMSAPGIRGPGARGPASTQVRRRHSIADTGSYVLRMTLFAARPAAGFCRRTRWLCCQMLHSACVGDRRAARMAGSSPAAVPMSTAAASPPAQASGGMTVSSRWA